MSSSQAGFKWQPPTPAPGEMAGSALSFLNSHHRSCVVVLVINGTAHVNPQATCDRLRMNRDVCKHRYSKNQNGRVHKLGMQIQTLQFNYVSESQIISNSPAIYVCVHKHICMHVFLPSLPSPHTDCSIVTRLSNCY